MGVRKDRDSDAGTMHSPAGVDFDIMSLGDLALLERQIESMRKRKEILQKHEHKIFFSSGSWMTYVVEGGKRKRIKRKDRKELEDYLVKLLREQDNSPKVEEVFQEWNDNRLEAGRVIGSTHLRDKRNFKRYFEGSKLSRRRMKETTPQEWADFIQAHFDRGLTAKQWAGLRGIVRAVVKYSVRKMLITWRYDDIIDMVDMHFVTREVHEDGEEILYADELQALREHCLSIWGVHERCLWLVSYTGTRIGEAVALKPEDIDLEHMVITVRRTETRGDEQGRPRVVVREGAKTAAGMRQIVLPRTIENEVRDIVERAQKAGWEYLFCQRSGKRLSAESMRRKLKSIEEKSLEIPDRPPHKLRKTVASILCDSGQLTDKQIIGQLGHTDIETTRGFYSKDRSTLEDRARILEAIPEIGGKKDGDADKEKGRKNPA
ncbi:MAG: site-specific integrase [Lachnospiraceae bacterium]|nr:site-specific integrase [Lachnospiraceae bacterium]